MKFPISIDHKTAMKSFRLRFPLVRSWILIRKLHTKYWNLRANEKWVAKFCTAHCTAWLIPYSRSPRKNFFFRTFTRTSGISFILISSWYKESHRQTSMSHNSQQTTIFSFLCRWSFGRRTDSVNFFCRSFPYSLRHFVAPLLPLFVACSDGIWLLFFSSFCSFWLVSSSSKFCFDLDNVIYFIFITINYAMQYTTGRSAYIWPKTFLARRNR